MVIRYPVAQLPISLLKQMSRFLRNRLAKAAIKKQMASKKPTMKAFQKVILKIVVTAAPLRNSTARNLNLLAAAQRTRKPIVNRKLAGSRKNNPRRTTNVQPGNFVPVERVVGARFLNRNPRGQHLPINQKRFASKFLKVSASL